MTGPAQPGKPTSAETTQPPEQPEFARAEMGLFMAVFGTALSFFLALQTVGIVLRSAISLGILVVGIPVIALLAPRVNRLVDFLAHPHRPGEYTRTFRHAAKAKSQIGHPLAVPAVIVALLTAITSLLVFVLPAQAKTVRCQVAETAIQKSEILTRDALGLVSREPDKALLVSLHGVHSFPAAERLAECDISTAGPSAGLAEVVSAVAPIETHIHFDSPVRSLATSDTAGLSAAGLEDGGITLWEGAANAVVLDDWQAHEDAVAALEFSPDGEILVSVTDSGSIRAWLTRDLTLIDVRDDAHTGAITDIAFAADGRSFATTGDDGRVRIWTVNPRQFALSRELGDGARRLFAVSLSASGDQAAWAVGNLLIIDDTSGRAPLILPTNHTGVIRTVEHSPRDPNWVLTAGVDGTIRMWDTEAEVSIFELEAHDNTGVRASHFSADGSLLVSVGADNRLVIWDLDPREPAAVVEIPMPTPVIDVRFLEDGFVAGIAAGDRRQVVVWDIAASQPLAELVAVDVGAVSTVAVSPGGATAAIGGARGALALVDVAHRGPLARQEDAHVGVVRSVAFSPSNELVASSGADGVLRLWASQGLEPIDSLVLGIGAVRSVSFDRRGEAIVAGGADGVVVVQADPLRIVQGPLDRHDGPVRTVAFSPSSSQFVSGGEDGQVLLWTIGSDTPDDSPIAHQARVWSVAFDDTGNRIVSASADGRMMIWDLSRNEIVAQTDDLGQVVWSVTFSGDGRLVAAGVGHDIALWSGLGPELLGDPLGGHEDVVRSVAFVGTSLVLWSGDAAGDVLVWDLGVDSLVARACAVANRNMTMSEWRSFAGVDDYQRHCAHSVSGTDSPADAEPIEYGGS